MKQSFLRIILGTLILALGLAASLGFVAHAYENRLPAQQRVLFSGTEGISLYSRDGTLLQTLVPGPGGQAASRPVPSGNYFAFSGSGCTEFFLNEKSVPVICGGSGWTDGRTLHVCRETAGALWIRMPVPDDSVHSICLTGGSFFRRELVCGRASQKADFFFPDLPFGTYLLYLDDKLVTRITLDAGSPQISFSFV